MGVAWVVLRRMWAELTLEGCRRASSALHAMAFCLVFRFKCRPTTLRNRDEGSEVRSRSNPKGGVQSAGVSNEDRAAADA